MDSRRRKVDFSGANHKWVSLQWMYVGFCWFWCWSGFFSQLDTRESRLGRGSISGGIAFLSVSKSGASSRFMADVGGPSLLWIDSPGQRILYKKSG